MQLQPAIHDAELPPLVPGTRDVLEEFLDRQVAQPFTQHLEVETYTWDVLPDALRDESVTDAVARELRWVLGRTGGP